MRRWKTPPGMLGGWGKGERVPDERVDSMEGAVLRGREIPLFGGWGRSSRLRYVSSGTLAPPRALGGAGAAVGRLGGAHGRYQSGGWVREGGRNLPRSRHWGSEWGGAWTSWSPYGGPACWAPLWAFGRVGTGSQPLSGQGRWAGPQAVLLGLHGVVSHTSVPSLPPYCPH